MAHDLNTARRAADLLRAVCSAYADLMAAENRAVTSLQDGRECASVFLLVTASYLGAVGCVSGLGDPTAERTVWLIDRAVAILEAEEDDAPGVLPAAVYGLQRSAADMDLDRVADHLVIPARLTATARSGYDDDLWPSIKHDIVGLLRDLAGAIAGRRNADGRIVDAVTLATTLEHLADAKDLLPRLGEQAREAAARATGQALAAIE